MNPFYAPDPASLPFPWNTDPFAVIQDSAEPPATHLDRHHGMLLVAMAVIPHDIEIPDRDRDVIPRDAIHRTHLEVRDLPDHGVGAHGVVRQDGTAWTNRGSCRGSRWEMPARTMRAGALHLAGGPRRRGMAGTGVTWDRRNTGRS